MPIVFQSSEAENAVLAKQLGVGFINKYSKTLSHDLSDFILHNFGFGDFIFLNPKTLQEIGRANDLESLQNHIQSIPEDSFVFHCSRNELSKWLNARSHFPIAQLFKQIRLEDFPSSRLCQGIYP